MSDLAEEAVYAALLYINQRTPRPRAARALMDALRQDGYEVRPLAPTPPDALREADASFALREIARSRRIEAAARLIHAEMGLGFGRDLSEDAHDALRAALEAEG